MGIRLDRGMSVHCVAPVLRRVAPRARIPILMYHSISDEKESCSRPYYRTVTAPEVFAQHMRHLHGAGYQTLSLDDAVRALAAGLALPKSVVITFDDGFADLALNALPILQQFGFIATAFLPTTYIGDSPLYFKNKRCLSWREVRELSRYGICFGSHTVTHPRLELLSSAEVKEEITVSKRVIEDALGLGVSSFAYPYAFPETKQKFKLMLHDLLCGAGYREGVCTTIGSANQSGNRFFMPRLPVNSDDDMDLFTAKLDGAYDWIGGPQRAVKFMKSAIDRKPVS